MNIALAGQYSRADQDKHTADFAGKGAAQKPEGECTQKACCGDGSSRSRGLPRVARDFSDQAARQVKNQEPATSESTLNEVPKNQDGGEVEGDLTPPVGMNQ